jgi:hypothetical protein
LRRERDSNPRNLAVQRFSRPPQSTTLPSLQYFSDFVHNCAIHRYFLFERLLHGACTSLKMRCKNIPFFKSPKEIKKNIEKVVAVFHFCWLLSKVTPFRCCFKAFYNRFLIELCFFVTICKLIMCFSFENQWMMDGLIGVLHYDYKYQ